MIPISRRANSAIRALRLASSSSRSIITPSVRLLSRPARISLPSVRAFSSIADRFQQATAAVDTPTPTQSQPPENAQAQEFTRFQELADAGLISPRVIDTIVQRMNIHTMTEVQQMTLNHCLDGSDVIAQAKTGTGKTLAFLMPIVQRILRDSTLEQRRAGRASIADIRALIISPTRELAEQIAVEAKKIVGNTSVKVQTAVGGTQKSYHLQQMQREGCHILVGTPGRVLDLLSDSSSGVALDNIDTFVLDEADRLLDIGFAPAIADIQSYMPSRSEGHRQTLMFSATVPQSVVRLVRETLRPDFKFIRTVDPDESPTHERIPQQVVFGRGLQNQIPIIMEIAHNAIESHKNDPDKNLPFKAIIYFGSTAEVALAYDAFAKMRDPDQPRSLFQPHPLDPCRIFHIHGKLAQAQRTRESQGFRNAKSAILLSSDVTARGMDFPNVSHVIQVGLPKSSDDYVHRIGRTGRAGKSGEGWLILNGDERRDIDIKMRNSGINLREAELVTAGLDMTRGAQIPAHIARLLKLVEVGVKSVPYNVKAATYSALLGVLQQQNPNRSKQQQIDMMNELAKFGWGMQDPPGLSRHLVNKIGFGHVSGIRIENDREVRGDRDRGRGFGQDSRDSRRREQNSSFGRSVERKGVFGGGVGGDAFDQMGFGSRGRSGGGRRR